MPKGKSFSLVVGQKELRAAHQGLLHNSRGTAPHGTWVTKSTRITPC